MQVGDLVRELLPLMAGDAIPRLGIITEAPVKGTDQWCKVLFDKEELVHYNALTKVEA